MVDLHRHDEYSSFDGFGKADVLAKLAKELGHTSLSSTNHGNTNGLVQTYQAAKEQGLKAILGVEGYFLPKVNPEDKKRGYHLLIVAKNLKGYGNLNRLQYEGEKQKYYNPIWDFELLEKYSEGLICTSACVAGYLGQCIANDNFTNAEKFLVKMKSIFKDDFYVEIQPYTISEVGLQEKINYHSIRLAKKLNIKCILTSDSHYGRKEDFDTYMKMHEVAKHTTMDIPATYEERYMPTEKDLLDRFLIMHTKSLSEHKCFSINGSHTLGKQMMDNLQEIEDKCELDYLDELKLELPKLFEDETDSFSIITQAVKNGLKSRGVFKKEYIDRCKQELSVIKHHDFSDYFLIVADYVNWAKSQGIAVGPGRGSVCNCLVAYALGITEVDSLFFDLDFNRFLRKDKSKIPDIDLDFQTSRRQEVIEYICKKYEGHAARICSYGLYKVDNLLNDLAKVCGMYTNDFNGKEIVDKSALKEIKSFVNSTIVIEGRVDEDAYSNSAEVKRWNKDYDNILLHFVRLFKKMRFIGTHAAGVAITGGKLLDYVALKIDKDGKEYTNYDLGDAEYLNLVKFDILGLNTMETISDLRYSTGDIVDYKKVISDNNILELFKEKECDGIFQFENGTPRRILSDIQCDSFNDVVAASAMNRPGPLSLKMPELYAANKFDPGSNNTHSVYEQYVESTYGTIIYQEQVQSICRYVGEMEWADADKVMKIMKGGNITERALVEMEKNKGTLLAKFIKGASKNGLKEEEARDLFEKMLCYTFNKGHSVGYSLISIEEMYYKQNHPVEFWYSKIKHVKDDAKVAKFREKAVKSGAIVFLPHVNYSYDCTVRKVEGEKVIQEGYVSIKNVGEKAAMSIFEEKKRGGIFTSFDNFYDRCKSRSVTSRVIDALKNDGALEFDKKRYISRVVKFNSSLASRASMKGE